MFQHTKAYLSSFYPTEADFWIGYSGSDNILLHRPLHMNLFEKALFEENGKRILSLDDFYRLIYLTYKNEFYQLLKLDDIEEVKRDRTEFSDAENEKIDLYCFCNQLKRAYDRGKFETPFSLTLPVLPEELKGSKFSLVIQFLEKKAQDWAYLTAAFLLADIIETHVDLAELSSTAVDAYWLKRFHDAISFVEKAVQANLALKASADMLLLHIKTEAGEYYPTLKRRINSLLLEPDIKNFNAYKRNSVQALLPPEISFLHNISKNSNREDKQETLQNNHFTL